MAKHRKYTNQVEVDSIIKRHYRDTFNEGPRLKHSQSNDLTRAALDNSAQKSKTMKNYQNLKKAGFDMSKHRIASFLIHPTLDINEDTESVEIDDVKEVALCP